MLDYFKMKTKLNIFYSILLTSLIHSDYALAQESVNSAGGDAAGSGGSAAYSIGQVVYTTAIGSGGSSEQGVQHAYEIFTINKETVGDFSISVFPNPTADKLIVEKNGSTNEKISYQLYDVAGKLLLSEAMVDKQTQINMINLPTATYFINVTNQNNKQIQTFKIIKIN